MEPLKPILTCITQIRRPTELRTDFGLNFFLAKHKKHKLFDNDL